jgi:hypothetical protein
MTVAQILAVILAAFTAACCFQASRVLGPEGTGWLGGPWLLRLGLDLAALFWTAGAVYALSHPSITRWPMMVLVVIFAKLALIILIWSLRRRAPPAH